MPVEITKDDLGHKPCMVTAHPDDETLWAGGLLSRFSDLGWTIICCSTPRLDPMRAHHFWNACLELGAFRVLCNTQVEGAPPHLIPDVGDFLWGALKNIKPDVIVTHGQWGEYGHNQHAQIHQAVMSNFEGRVLGFGWGKGRVADDHALECSLTDAEVARKRRAMHCYGDKCPALRKRYYDELGVPEKREFFDVYRI